MRKKYLSALLFGALLVTSAGTFTSCKDYDDDINNLQEQITANADAIKKLQEMVDNGDYVTNVEKSAEGIVITFKKGGAQTIALEDKVGSIVTVNEDGVLCIDGKPTDIKAAETDPEGEDAKSQIIIGEDNCWQVLQEDGTYKTTNIPVSGVIVSGSEADGFTLTIYDETGTPSTVKLPSAASLITSIDLKDLSADNRVIALEHAKFTKPSNWKGKAKLPSTDTEIYVGGTIDIRVNPVDAPVTDVEFTLINPKNTTLSHVILTAIPSELGEGNPTIGDMAGRASYTGNGLYTLSVKSFTLTKDEQQNISWENKGVSTSQITDINSASAWAVNANSEARSEYGVAVSATNAKTLTKIQIKDVEKSEAGLHATTPTAKTVTLKVGNAYKILGVDKDQYLYDTWFEFTDKDKEVFGIEYDDLNRTFKITKNPDSATTDVTIPVTVHTLDIAGTEKIAKYNIRLSAEVSSNIEYDPVTFNIANLKDYDYNNDAIILSIDKFKEANSTNWDKIIYGAKLNDIKYNIYTDAACTENKTEIDITTSTQGTTVTPNGSLTAIYAKADGKEATEVTNLQNIVLFVNSDNKSGLSLDKKYYLKVSFMNGNSATSEAISSFVVPVTFTAPSVADLFVAKEGFVDADGNIVMYYDKNTDNKPQLVESFFKSTDNTATLVFDTNTVFSLNGIDYKSNMLAGFVKNASGTDLDQGTSATVDSYIELVEESLTWPDNTGREYGYGQVLTVKATAQKDGDDYLFNGTEWKYAEKSDKISTKFTVKVMSPIYEGQISYEGDAISVKANNEGGAMITADMVWLTDYNKNKYTIVPNSYGDDSDKAGEIVDQNNGTDDKDYWSAAQIENVVIDITNSDYISTVQYRLPKAATDDTPAVEGAFVITAKSVVNTVTDYVNIKVTDRWGYTKTFTNVPIKIVVE